MTKTKKPSRRNLSIFRLLRAAKQAVLGRRRLPTFLQPLLRRFVKPHLAPRFVMVSPSYECQARCLHCGIENCQKSDGVELDTQELFGIFDQAAEMGAKGVYITGGEPLLRSDFLDLVNDAVSSGLRVRFDTNGLLLDHAMARRLKDLGGSILVGVSLDSPDRHEHDENRKVEGIYDAAIEAIRCSVREGLSVNISYFVTRESLATDSLERTMDLGKRLGVDGIRILTPANTGRLIEEREMKLTREEEDAMRARLEPGFAFVERKDVTATHRCPAMGMECIYISPYGEVQPCIYVPVAFGNVREEPLEAIVRRMWNHEMYCSQNNTGCLSSKLPCDVQELLVREKDLPVDIHRTSGNAGQK